MFSVESIVARKILREADIKPASRAGREAHDMLRLGALQLRERAKKLGIQRKNVEFIWLAAREMPDNESALRRTKRELHLSDDSARCLLAKVRDAATVVLVEMAGVAGLNRLIALQQPVPADCVGPGDAEPAAAISDHVALPASAVDGEAFAREDSARQSPERPIPIELLDSPILRSAPPSNGIGARSGIAVAADAPSTAPRLKLWFPEPFGEPERASDAPPPASTAPPEQEERRLPRLRIRSRELTTRTTLPLCGGPTTVGVERRTLIDAKGLGRSAAWR